MPAATWSITIIAGANPGDPARFDPPNLQASAGDILSWNNTDVRQSHQPYPTDGQNPPNPLPLYLGTQLWNPISPNGQSPAWKIPAASPSGGKVFNYFCMLDPGAIGTITIP
jgi:plastocyanin